MDKRRHIPVSLQMCLIAITVGVVVMASDVYRRQSAIRLINRAGGKVHGEFPGPMWLKGMLHRNRLSGLGEVRTVTFLAVDTPREAFDVIGRLPTLERLVIAGPEVTDAAVGKLQGLGRLRLLFIYDSNITDVGLAHLSSLTSLEQLHVSASDVTDSGLMHLRKLSRLTALELHTPRVSKEASDRLKIDMARASPSINDDWSGNRSFAFPEWDLH